ncbi:MAG: RluA family pseudouridine synthase [Firmicutes bacterium]|nr:RluA family pseudouridine synthase [Bacillota bacterium]
MITEYEIIADEASRLDTFLAKQLPELSRSRIQNMIKAGEVTVDGTPAKKAGMMLEGGEEILLAVAEALPLEVEAEDIPLDVVYEDHDIIVVNKPQGMVVHPAPGHTHGTLVNALLHHCDDLSGINGVARPGIVHRIDKDTSGLLVVAKNDAAHVGLAEQWKGHNIKRIYHALLEGVMAEMRGTIDAPIGRHPSQRLKNAVEPKNGKPAITHYRVLERFPAYTYAEMQLETGRTHQIRVHMAHLGHPVAGDRLYGPRKQKLDTAGQVLHAKVLGFKHPTTGEYMEFDSQLPPYFQKLLDELEKQV